MLSMYVCMHAWSANIFGHNMGFSSKHAPETGSVFFRKLQRHFSDTFLAKLKHKEPRFSEATCHMHLDGT